MTATLYNRQILALAVTLADFPRLTSPMRTGERRAPLCGSRVTIDMDMAAHGTVARLGLAVEACALGQAAAALLARAAPGQSAAALAAAHGALAAWLTGTSDTPPLWPGVAVLAAARAHPARHAAILLPFALAADLAADLAAARAQERAA